MSEDLFLTFQSQLSVVMETILKSAMFEITRLVEDSFLEEVGRRKQEVEVLRRRLQLSESKLRERERGKGKRIPGSNCGQTGASRDRNDRHDRQPLETVQGVDTLSINLSLLREQSTSGFPLTEEVWSSRQQTDSNTVTMTQSYSRKKNNAHKESATEITTPNSNTQIPQEVLQRLLSSTAVLSEPSGGFKSRENVLEKCEKDLTLNNEMDSDQSRLLQSPFPQDVYEDLASSPKSKVKSEAELDLLPVKEEEEMVPVWDSINRDDGCHEEMVDRSDGELTGSCDQEEIQVDSFPGLNSLDMQDATSYFTPYSVNTLIHQSIKPQHLCTTELALSSIPEESDSLVQQENGQNCTDPDGSENSAPYSHDDVCSGEKIIRHIQYSKHFFQDKRGIHEKVHAERSHHCTLCGRTFMKACDLRAHMMIHKGKKPLSCPHCDQTFAYNFELKVHQRHHSGERPHVCTDCGKGFARLSNFKQHQNIHTREKLFSCTQCGMRFNRATNLRVHLRRHSHAGKTYNCPQCGKGFLGPRQMKAHLLKFHGRGGK